MKRLLLLTLTVFLVLGTFAYAETSAEINDGGENGYTGELVLDGDEEIADEANADGEANPTGEANAAVGANATGEENEVSNIRYTGDINDIVTEGYVYVEAGGKHLPVGGEAFIVRTVLYNETGEALMQTAYGWNSGNIYHRRKVSGEFRDWISVTKKTENVRYIAFGDSLMWGAEWVEADNEDGYEIVQAAREFQMPTIIAKAVGACDNFSNEAVSGMAFVPASGESMLDKIKSVDISGAELITLGGGRNDSDTPLGTAEDSIPGDGTICGAVMEILDYITEQNPFCQIVMTQVTPATGDNSIIFTKEYGGGWSLNSYRDEVSRVCAEYGVPFVSWDGCT